MSKTKVNEVQYVKLVHEKMQDHDMYKAGMGVKLDPENSELPSGLTEVGGIDAKSILSWAEKEVQKEYELVVTRIV